MGVRCQRGYSLLEENTPFVSPQRRTRGDPSTPDIAGLRLEELHTLRNVSAVYMASPWIFCESLRLATAPYYREARVTFAWRRTACEIAALLRSPH